MHKTLPLYTLSFNRFCAISCFCTKRVLCNKASLYIIQTNFVQEGEVKKEMWDNGQRV